MSDVYERFNEENDKIYLDTIPSDMTIMFPDGKTMMKPTAYTLPDATDVPIKYTKGSDCVLQ